MELSLFHQDLLPLHYQMLQMFLVRIFALEHLMLPRLFDRYSLHGVNIWKICTRKINSCTNNIEPTSKSKFSSSALQNC